MSKEKKHTEKTIRTVPISKINIKFISILLLAVLLLSSGVSYFLFNSKKSSVPAVPENVKGASDSLEFELPMPESSIKLASNRTSEIQQVTIQSEKNSEEVHSFYQNVLFDQGFKLESETQDDGFTTKVYASDNRVATIVASAQTGEEYSIVSIELVNKSN